MKSFKARTIQSKSSGLIISLQIPFHCTSTIKPITLVKENIIEIKLFKHRVSIVRNPTSDDVALSFEVIAKPSKGRMIYRPVRGPVYSGFALLTVNHINYASNILRWNTIPRSIHRQLLLNTASSFD
jgi:hypothetical protein